MTYRTLFGWFRPRMTDAEVERRLADLREQSDWYRQFSAQPAYVLRPLAPIHVMIPALAMG